MRNLPLETIREIDHEFSPQGQGNVVSLEFNLLYRWHACVSEQDTEWTEGEFNRIFKGKDFSTVSPFCLRPREPTISDYWLEKVKRE
jgi:hypothetical protein